MMGLTHGQAKLLEFIRAHIRSHGIAPSYEEARIALGFHSKSSILRLMDHLEHRGAIHRMRDRFGKVRPMGIILAPDADHHEPDCACDRCARARYMAQVKLVQAVSVLPPVRIAAAGADNFIRVTDEKRAALLGVKPRRAAPRTRAAVPAVTR